MSDAKMMNWIAGVLASLTVLGIMALFTMSQQLAELRVEVKNMSLNLETNQRETARRVEAIEAWQRAVLLRDRIPGAALPFGAVPQ